MEIEGYNCELSDDRGFIGDHASGRAFRTILDSTREILRTDGEDPLGDVASAQISKKRLDRLIAEGDIRAAGVVLGAIEEFAQEFAKVIDRFMRLKEWKGTERIVVGGGLRASRIGELAIGRTAVLLTTKKRKLDLVPVRHHPDEAGLIGCVHLAPPWIFSGHDAILAVDIGGANIRVGVVEVKARKLNIAGAKVVDSELWRHANDDPDREAAVKHLMKMLAGDDQARR